MNEQDRVVLLESVRARTNVAPVSMLGVLAPPVLFTPFLLSENVYWLRIALWVFPTFCTMVARTIYSRRVISHIDNASEIELKRADRWLRISSVINQALVGSGIWLIQSQSTELLILPLFVTLLVVMFSMGVMSNLFSDFKSYAFSAPFLLGQPAIFWFLQPGFGYAAGIALVTAIILSYALVRHGSKIFRESILMRFEKNRLLQEVETQKSRTEAALAEAHAANQSKAFFMAAASHDIKQPLHAVGMLTDTLLMSDLPDSAMSILEKQRGSINRMTHLFDDLMDLSRFEGGMFDLRMQRVQAHELLQILDEEYSPLCERQGLDWSVHADAATLETDPDLLLRLLRNLLQNALRYTQEGQISCRATKRNEQVSFSVSDTGRGIAKADQHRIFDQFVRLQNGDEDTSGAGLGLAIVKYIGDALGANLSLESTPGQGTTFSVTLPLIPVDEPAVSGNQV